MKTLKDMIMETVVSKVKTVSEAKETITAEEAVELLGKGSMAEHALEKFEVALKELTGACKKQGAKNVRVQKHICSKNDTCGNVGEIIGADMPARPDTSGVYASYVSAAITLENGDMFDALAVVSFSEDIAASVLEAYNGKLELYGVLSDMKSGDSWYISGKDYGDVVYGDLSAIAPFIKKVKLLTKKIEDDGFEGFGE